MIFPNPLIKKKICAEENVIIFTECYCPNGHDLITAKAKFDKFDGILLKISTESSEGLFALSPVYGCKTRISVEIDLKEGEQYNFSCPECNVPLPVYTKCHCGANIFTLFLNNNADFHSFLGACDRIGCTNSYIQLGEEIVTSARLDFA